MKDEMLLAWVDGDLDQAGRARVSEHIVGCVECHRTIDELKEVTGALGKWAVPEPEALPTARELLDRAGVPPSAAPGSGGWRDFIRRYGAVAGIALFATVAGLVVLPRYMPNDRSSSIAMSPPETTAVPPGQARGGAAPASNSSTVQQPDSSVTTPSAPAAGIISPETQDADPASGGKLAEDDAKATGPVPADAPVTSAGEEQGRAAEPPSPPPAARQPAAAPAESETAGSRDDGKADKVGATAPGAGGYAVPKPSTRSTARRESGSAVVRRADVAMSGAEASEIADRVAGVARAGNGSVTKRWSRSKDADGDTVTIEISVPAEQFEQTISRLRSVGNVQSVRRSAIDLSGRMAEIDDELADERKNEDASVAKKQKAPSKEGLQRERRSLEARAERAVITVTIVGKP